jgi:hypothetical protein
LDLPKGVRERTLLKTFVAGIVIGIVGCGALLYFVPVVDQYREASITTLSPNGGNSEEFHINVPIDRILIGAPGRQDPLPPGLDWPDDGRLAGIGIELFKIRNRKDAVVGVASRLAANDSNVGEVIEWVLHLPARGSMFVTMQANTSEGGRRSGELRAGTNEFAPLVGRLTERWVHDAGNAENASAGRIELLAVYVAAPEDLE